MAARAGGGVYVAYDVGYPSAKTIRILNVDTGATLDFPVSGERAQRGMARGSGRPDLGRWEQGDRMKAVHTNAAGTRARFGRQRGARHAAPTPCGRRRSPARAGGADVVYTATTQKAINVWHTQIARTLTVKAEPVRRRRRSGVTFTVTDAGDPVAGATVRFGSRTGDDERVRQGDHRRARLLGPGQGQGEEGRIQPGHDGRARALTRRHALTTPYLALTVAGCAFHLPLPNVSGT